MKTCSLFLVAVLLLWAFTLKKKDLPKKIKKEFVYVPSGTVLVEQDTLNVQAFYMQIHEVSNAQYRSFLEEVKPQLTEKEWQVVQVHSEQWSQVLAYEDAIKKHYFSHEAYSQYPVVNITYEGAQKYCLWLEQKINKQLPLEGDIQVRLPERSEFIRTGAVGDQVGGSYTWGTNSLQNAKGMYLCNFVRIPQSMLTKDDQGNIIMAKSGKEFHSDEYFLTASVKSYFPNEFGLYNLNGNVAEMLADNGLAAGGSWHSYGYDVRLQSLMNYEGPSPEVGFRPVFTYVSR